jgi:precorrin isomerase
LVRQLYEEPLSGEEIERRSFAAIDRETPSHGFSPGEWEVVRRMIHTGADFSLVEQVRFSPDAIRHAVRALQAGKPIYVDSNMIRAGISLARLKGVCPAYDESSIHCYVAHREVGEEARAASLPRALFAVRRARGILDGALILFGNSPVGLLELNRMIIEEDVRPSLVVGMPVGFVHVVESKEELMRLPVPWIVLQGRRGGSPLAVATLHALCTLATRSSGAQIDAGAVGK